MNTPTDLSFTWLLAADFLTAVSFVLALYIFFLSPSQRANRYVSLAVLIIAVSDLGIAMTLAARTYDQAVAPFALVAALSPIAGPMLTLATLVLVKPEATLGRWRWLRNGLLLLAIIPAALTLVDQLAGTNLYYPGINAGSYLGGYIEFFGLLTGTFGRPVVIFYVFTFNIALIFLQAYFAFLDRKLDAITRRLALILFVVQLVGVVFNLVFNNVLPTGVATLVVSTFYVLGYSYIAFQQMISAQQLAPSRLRTRLTTLVLAISLPIFILLSNLVVYQARDLVENVAAQRLQEQSASIQGSTTAWLDLQVRMLDNLASQPGIVSMDAERQKPILVATAKNYPYMYLISTTDLSGMNVARNDDVDLTDYSDRVWFKSASAGAEITYQLLIGRTTGRPALVASVPVRDADGIIGVAMFASELTAISDIVAQSQLGESGYAYLVNEENILVAHPELDRLMREAGGADPKLVNFEGEAPIEAARAGQTTAVRYIDADGEQWLAFSALFENGWVLVTQQKMTEILSFAQPLQRLAWGLIGVSSIFLFLLIWATMRQAFQPVTTLTETVKSITAGNLERVAPIESGDEIGTLAQAFNVMTGRLRDMISGLEQRVAERTLDLEHRSSQLQAAAEVGRAAATIRELDELLPLVANLISERFGFYHIGIFLLDERKEFAVLRAANSEGGQRMLARGHRLRVGQQGIVGSVTEQRKPRIALNVGEDAAFFNNPDLRNTQSEMALPLIVGNELMGALDVQSEQAGAFTEQDVQTLSVLADQVAIAINQTRLLQQTEQLLETERRLYGDISRRAWLEQMRSMRHLGVRRTQEGVIPVRDIQDVQLRTVLESGRAVVDKEDELVLYAPVRVRGQVVGAMRTRRASDSGRWTGEDIRLVEELAEQLSLSLESARSYQETQLAAQRERLLGEIGGHIRQTLDLESILRTTSQEVRQALDLQRVVVRLGVPPAGDGVDLDREDLERVDPLTSGVGDDGHEPPTQPTDSESGGSND